MTSPLSNSAREPVSGSTPADRRHKLARKWAYLVSLTAYLPMPHADVERELLDLVNRLFDAMTSEPMSTDRIAKVGARLVELNCVGKASLQCTMDALAGALLAEPELRRFDRLPERVAHLLGALASGYAEAIRSTTMEQQDNLHRALLEAMWISERKLRTSESRLNKVLTCSSSGIAITDLDGRLVRVNAGFDRLVDRSAESGRDTLFELVRPEDSVNLREAYRDLLDGKIERLALRPRLRRRDGAIVRASLTASLLRDADGHASDYVTIVVDDAEPVPARDHLPRDGVTGLPSRELFTTHLKRVLASATPTTLYELELDGFAALTDGLGRQVGDDLLRAIAGRLSPVVAELADALVARFDGGTFAILVESSPTAPDTVTVIKQINHAFAEPVRVGNLRVPVSVSIGVAHQRSRDTDPTDLVREADLALRRAKRKGRGQWAVFDPDRDARHRDDVGLATTMPDAWDNGQLRVVYRPVVRLADEQVLGVEGLLRWDHPVHGSMSHQRCQQLVEHTGYVLPLGNLLLRRACEQIRLRSETPVWVNLTAPQAADRDLVGRVTRVLDDTGMPPARLQLGVPTAGLHDNHGAADNLRGLAGVGVVLVAHHFRGTPEDLACLEDLPVRVVRLAPSLVRRQAHRPDPESLVAKAVSDLVALVHLAGATVTVDDLHTRAQANWWHQAGADTATGPLFA